MLGHDVSAFGELPRMLYVGRCWGPSPFVRCGCIHLSGETAMDVFSHAARTAGRSFLKVVTRSRTSPVTRFDDIVAGPLAREDFGEDTALALGGRACGDMASLSTPVGYESTDDDDKVVERTATASTAEPELDDCAIDLCDSMDMEDDEISCALSVHGSLFVSESSASSDEAEPSTDKPPLMPGELSEEKARSKFDGEWVLCNKGRGVSSWLESLTIQDNLVIDGDGALCPLPMTRRGPKLFGGMLKRKGAALVRVGKTGGVLVYLRRQS